MTYLLDVNVLIALLDPRHIFHDAVQDWFARETGATWATCPITQNGFVRVVSGKKYQPAGVSIPDASAALSRLAGRPDHVFWPDDVSLFNSPLLNAAGLVKSDQITDVYLLAMAVSRGGKLATTDRKIAANAINGGANALHLIHTSNDD